MSNPYAAWLPPALVMVGNNPAFNSGNLDDSDLSSLNTTPSTSSARKLMRLSSGEINEADLGLDLSGHNRTNPYRIPGERESRNDEKKEDSTKNPSLVVQVDRADAPKKGNDLQDVNEQEDRGRNREAVIEDRKEKYRRMASEPRRMRGNGVMNSWKKKADEIREKAERGTPWYVTEDFPDDEGEETSKSSITITVKSTPDDEEADKISPLTMKSAPDSEDEISPLTMKSAPDSEDEICSPIKATRHSFENEPKERCSESKNDSKKKTSVETPESASDRRKSRSVITCKNRPPPKDSGKPPLLDMYGCAIFRVESEEESQEDLAITEATLDQLDANMATEDESLTAMLSNASLFSAKAAQKFTEEGVKLLEGAGQAVENLVLGPVQEVDESAVPDVTSDTDDSEAPPPPPKTPPRMPKWWLQDELGRRWVKRDGTEVTSLTISEKVEESVEADRSIHDESDVEASTSYVLNDSSDMDVTCVLDDVAAFDVDGKTNEASDSKENESSTKRVIVEAEEEGRGAVPHDYKDDKLDLDEKTVDSPGDVKAFPIKDFTLATEDESCAIDTKEAGIVGDYHLHGVGTEKDADKGEIETNEAEAPKNVDADKGDIETKEDDSPKNVETSVEKNCSSNKTQCGEDAVDAASAVDAADPSENAAKSVMPVFDDDSKQAGDLSVERVLVQGDVTDVEQNAPSEASDEEPKDFQARADIVAGDADLASSLASPVSKPVKDNANQTVVPSESKKSVAKANVALPEFPPPPTDDADLEFDIASAITQNSEITPVRNNLGESKVITKKETKDTWAAATSVRPKEATTTKSAVVYAAKSKPAMVKTLDDNNGIAKGDIFISLLNTNLNESNRAPKGADQIRDAILRMRNMRRRQEKVEMVHYEPEETSDLSPSAKRSVLPVDLDDVRVVSGFDHVKTLEEEAIEHLKHDEIDAAIELYEEIAFTYNETFKAMENTRKLSRSKKPEKKQYGHKAYLGAVLHNIGILYMLKFDFNQAFYHFTRAAINRKSHFGVGSVDHMASLSKVAVCYYAMDDFEEAHKGLEEVLELSKNHLAGLTDFMQIAEILNNLGVLYFMCGQSGAALTLFRECLEIQNAVLKHSIYSGPRLGGHSSSLGISVTRGNVGYIRMLSKDAGAAIVEFESSLMHQQMILNDAHDSLISTMDRLAMAHLLAHKKEEATKMLSRMLRAQLDAYGPDDERCVLTLRKLQVVQTRKTNNLEQALEQLWTQHTSACTASKFSKTATSTKVKNMLKKYSFRKKVAKLSH